MNPTEYPVVLTQATLEASNEDVVDANVNAVNAMYQELLTSEEMSADALRSYFVDFFLTQALSGGFAQYDFTVPEREDVDGYVREGLAAMGAVQHLDLFNRTAAAFDALSESDAEVYLDGELDESEERPATVEELDELDTAFETLLETEDLITLNAAWLRGLAPLQLDEEGLAAHIAERVALIPNLAERQAAAAEEALANAPTFELIIRELCELAGHELVKITMGDPNYVHDGEKTLAWHFTTDQGEFLMVEEDDEAFMIHPQSKEILAAVEFEDDEELAEA
ncbi:DMP19 family protein [Pseudarthrobacter sp. P1]|uniref:DMP19 family protein n=1 Tax=Pseudarthrobacter sp. P1 TaxID=3418418 RepID=UPI003CEA3726